MTTTKTTMATSTDEPSPSHKGDDAKGGLESFSGSTGSGDRSQVGDLDAPAQETLTEDETAPADTSEDTVGAGVPLLPPPDPSSGESVPKIKLGETVSFEELGPVIINADGTTRRIDNWDQMTDGERQVAWRRISQRNEERRRKLLLLEQEQQNNEARRDGAT
jgi:hypothetical protein